MHLKLFEPKCDVLVVEDAITMLTRIAERFGKETPLMVCLDGAAMPYLAAWQIAIDDDEPLSPIALVCVPAETNPFGG
jgi:hypothetical protein